MAPQYSWDHLFFPPALHEYQYFDFAPRHPFQPDAITFHPADALWAADSAVLAYGRSGSSALTRGQVAAILSSGGFAEPVFLGNWDDAPTGTQAFFAAHATFAVLAFRGTERSDWVDFATDLCLAPTEYSDTPQNGSVLTRIARTIPRLFPGLRAPESRSVHAGFLLALDAIWPETEERLRAFRTLYPGSPIVFTGHSLGAGLATIAAARFRQGPSMLYTLASPRVGNANFGRLLEQATAGRCYRIVHGNDIVASVPPESASYFHFPALGVHLTPPSALQTVPTPSAGLSEIAEIISNTALSAPPPRLGDHSPILYLQALRALLDPVS